LISFVVVAVIAVSVAVAATALGCLLIVDYCRPPPLLSPPVVSLALPPTPRCHRLAAAATCHRSAHRAAATAEAALPPSCRCCRCQGAATAVPLQRYRCLCHRAAASNPFVAVAVVTVSITVAAAALG
jgi:hypothetical protein